MSDLKEKLTRIVAEADDSLLQGIDNFVNHVKEEQVGYQLSHDQKSELDKRVKRYEAGEAKMYSWNEVKEKLKSRG